MENYLEKCKKIGDIVRKYLNDGCVYSEEENNTYQRIIFDLKHLTEENSFDTYQRWNILFKKHNINLNI